MELTYTAIVKCGYYDQNNEVIFSETGFSRCIAIYHGEQLVHCSRLHHPEGNVYTYYKRRHFLALRGSNDVYVQLENNQIKLQQLDIDKLDKRFHEILQTCTKEEIEEWLRLDRETHG